MYRLTEKEKNRAMTLLEDVLSTVSVNGQSREIAVAEYLEQYFLDTPYEARVQKIDEKRGNFLLEIPGEKKEGYIVWNGHMDTVPYGDPASWSSDPADPAVRDGKIYARGASDMKGGLCAMAFALHYMAEHSLKPSERIRFIGTCDEEKGGTGAEAILKEEFLGTPDFLLIGEPTDCNIGIAQKGCIWLEILVKGRTSHGAYPWMGVNAAELGFELCSQIKTYVSCQDHPILSGATAVLTRAEGGVANNMVPDFMRFVMDIRSVPGITHEKLLGQFQSLAELMIVQHPGLEIEMHVLNERIPVDIAPGNDYVRKLRGTAEKICGKVPEDIGIYFFTDASVFLREHKIPTVLFGPGSPALCHKPDEYMELDKYFQAIEVYINMLTE